MKRSILTKSEHTLIVDFLSDVMYGRPLKITPALRRVYKDVKKNIFVIRNHSGVMENLLEWGDRIEEAERNGT